MLEREATRRANHGPLQLSAKTVAVMEQGTSVLHTAFVLVSTVRKLSGSWPLCLWKRGGSTHLAMVCAGTACGHTTDRHSDGVRHSVPSVSGDTMNCCTMLSMTPRLRNPVRPVAALSGRLAVVRTVGMRRCS